MVKPAELLAEVTGFRLRPGLFDGAPARVDEIDVGGVAVPRITNELWTAKQRQGHSLHELSYRACFKAELPRFFLDRLTNPGDVVLDPFMGRGTTPLEAALAGRVPAGNDVNPLSRVLIEPRLDPPEESEAAERLDQILRDVPDPCPDPDEPDLSVFFHPETLAGIRALRRWFLAHEGDGALDRVDRWLRMVATNRLTGHSAGFFSGRTMPPNQAVSVDAQRKLNQRLRLVPPPRDVRAILLRKTRSLLRALTAHERATLARVRAGARWMTGDAHALDTLEDRSVRCTITSPPFLDVVDYAKDNWLRCWFNGLDAMEIGERITTRSKLEDWCAFLTDVFAELHRVTLPDGWVVFEVGEVRGGTLRLEEPVLPIATGAGFEVVGVVVHEQSFTKTANCWGVTNNSKGTNTNRLVLLRRSASEGKTCTGSTRSRSAS